jgi:segregation and condensation protein B
VSDDNVREPLLARLEALLFAAEEPIGIRRLARFLGLASEVDAARLVDRLRDSLALDGSAFVVQSIGEGFQLTTRSDLAPSLEPWLAAQEATPLSDASLKTLAVVAYRQPVTRADVDALRGAPSAEILRNLVDSGWVQVVGQEETLGRPKLYGTTRKFLQEFGLRSLGELPTLEGLSKGSP